LPEYQVHGALDAKMCDISCTAFTKTHAQLEAARKYSNIYMCVSSSHKMYINRQNEIGNTNANNDFGKELIKTSPIA
jgi:hypothetical protein